MLKVLRKARGYCRIYLGIGVTIILTIGTAVGLRKMPESERPRYRAARQRIGCQRVRRAFGYTVRIVGKVPDAAPMLYVSNHITALDPIVIGTAVEVSFAGKVEITRWLVLGWIANLHGIIGVVRDRRSRARQFVGTIEQRLREGIPVMVFPEGGIGWGEELLEFKTGAFQAAASGVAQSILPVFVDIVAIDGKPTPGAEGRCALTHKLHEDLYPHLAHVLGHRSVGFEVRFGTPFSTESMDRKALARAAHAAVSALQD